MTGHLEPATMVDAVRRHAAARPDHVAFRLLSDGENESAQLTFRELDVRARAVAAELQRLGARGERVLIAYPTGLDCLVALVACFYAGAVAVPCGSPQRRSDIERLRHVVADARPHVALVPAADRTAAVGHCGGDGPAVFDVSDVDVDSADDWQDLPLGPDALALLQYTSGSTQDPRGVVLSHGNVMSNQRAVALVLRHSADTVMVGWLPIFHDMGLIATVLQPLYLGALSVLMPPLAFLERPGRWLQAISQYRGTTSGGPNFAYDFCASRVPPDDRVGLDLSCWTTAFNGAEMVRAGTMERFASAFSPHGFSSNAFFPCYGLAEATLIVTGSSERVGARILNVDPAALRAGVLAKSTEEDSARTVTSCGPAVLDTEVLVVDPDTRKACSDGVFGEVWVRGPGIACGYWERPEHTASVFDAALADAHEGRFLRTGDLGCLLDGELVLAGRIKDLIVIRGRNFHPHDIEWTAESSHPALRPTCGAAFAVEMDDAERLVVAYEVVGSQDIDVEEIAVAIRTAVAEGHGVEVDCVAIVERSGVPKTTSGKIRRAACAEGFMGGRLPLVGVSWSAVGSGLELTGLPDRSYLAGLPGPEAVAALLAAMLHAIRARTRDCEVALGGDDPVRELGLDSLTAAELRHALQDRYGVVLGDLLLQPEMTFRQLATEVSAQMSSGAPTAAQR